MKVLLNSFHLNGHTLGFKKLEPPCIAASHVLFSLPQGRLDDKYSPDVYKQTLVTRGVLRHPEVWALVVLGTPPAVIPRRIRFPPKKKDTYITEPLVKLMRISIVQRYIINAGKIEENDVMWTWNINFISYNIIMIYTNGNFFYFIRIFWIFGRDWLLFHLGNKGVTVNLVESHFYMETMPH